jgi:hypothetical protein
MQSADIPGDIENALKTAIVQGMQSVNATLRITLDL